MTSTAHDIGALADFAPGIPHRISLNGRALVLIRKENTFYALRDTCPHQGAPLSAGHIGGVPRPCLPGQPSVYDREGEILICPWHGWEFDVRTGCSLFDPERIRVRTYPVRVANGRLLIQTP